MKRTIKIMPDYGCFPIWILDNNGMFENFNPTELSISLNLLSKLENWRIQFELTLDRSDPRNSGFGSDEQITEFENAGLNIWELLLLELPKDDVLFYSVLENKVLQNEN